MSCYVYFIRSTEASPSLLFYLSFPFPFTFIYFSFLLLPFPSPFPFPIPFYFTLSFPLPCIPLYPSLSPSIPLLVPFPFTFIFLFYFSNIFFKVWPGTNRIEFIRVNTNVRYRNVNINYLLNLLENSIKYGTRVR